MSNDERIAVLETTSAHISEALSRIENKLAALDTKIDNGMTNLNNKLDSRFDKLNDRMWVQFYWMIASYAGLLAVMAHGFHWF